ncbi:hypothetical protein WH47_07563 [Habropoda laboriosa]|uniref:PiggyBac transposable element-derived protein domain-containing protein n=1 Tax=Habropoda laboriosa TaxID=597456 RepID=A0A0L7RDP5_9HYME|nr:hypothetical protein WH47_07563 [Habropoda laboriosa]
MSVLPTNEEFDYVAFVEDDDVHNCEQSSDGASASNSDAEPETQDLEPDEFDIPKSTEDVVPEIQNISGRNWQHIAPSNNTGTMQNHSRNCSLTQQSQHVETIDECFHLFINKQIIDTIILHTNIKAQKNMPPNKIWKPVDHVEIDAFLGLLLLIGRCKESRECKQFMEGKQWNFSTILYRNNVTQSFYRYTV